MITSTQIGAIGENVVANELIVASGGRLSPFQPVADDDGIDLLIYDKKTGRAFPLQVKARTDTINKSGGRGKSNTVHFEVRKAAMKKERRAWVIGILLGEGMCSVERAWLFPMKDIPKIAGDRGTKYVVRPSKQIETKDKFKKYQCADMAEVAVRIVQILEK